MTLYINTASHEDVELTIKQGSKIIAQKKFKASRSQAEKLLPELDKLLTAKKIKLNQIKKVMVANQGGSFTSLRIGVITANALAYALKIPIEGEIKNKKKVKKFSKYKIIEPLYDREPAVGKPKK